MYRTDSMRNYRYKYAKKLVFVFQSNLLKAIALIFYVRLLGPKWSDFTLPIVKNFRRAKKE